MRHHDLAQEDAAALGLESSSFPLLGAAASTPILPRQHADRRPRLPAEAAQVAGHLVAPVLYDRHPDALQLPPVDGSLDPAAVGTGRAATGPVLREVDAGDHKIPVRTLDYYVRFAAPDGEAVEFTVPALVLSLRQSRTREVATKISKCTEKPCGPFRAQRSCRVNADAVDHAHASRHGMPCRVVIEHNAQRRHFASFEATGSDMLVIVRTREFKWKKPGGGPRQKRCRLVNSVFSVKGHGLPAGVPSEPLDVRIACRGSSSVTINVIPAKREPRPSDFASQ